MPPHMMSTEGGHIHSSHTPHMKSPTQLSQAYAGEPQHCYREALDLERWPSGYQHEDLCLDPQMAPTTNQSKPEKLHIGLPWKLWKLNDAIRAIVNFELRTKTNMRSFTNILQCNRKKRGISTSALLHYMCT